MKKGMALVVYSLSRLARSTDPVLTAKSKLAEVLNGLLGRDLSDAEVNSGYDVDSGYDADQKKQILLTFIHLICFVISASRKLMHT